jgi:putative ABC transport system permease protein
MTSAGGGTFARALVVAQLAVALVLVAAAGVLTRSFLATQAQRHGIGRSEIVTAWVTGVTVPVPTLADAKARLAALPGVDRVSIAIRAPLSLSGGGLAQPVDVPGVTAPDAPPLVKYGGVDTDYFETLGTRVLAGRTFNAADETSEPVVVISRAFADRYFPNGAVGRLVKPGGPQAEPRRVIGVVEDVVVNRIGEPAAPYLYHPFARVQSGDTTFLIATTATGAPGAALIGGTLAAVDRALIPRQIVPMREYLRYATSTYQTTATVALLLGAVGLALTMLGVYGVVATRTLDRTREFGIRRALGADRRQILRLVLRESGRIGLLGIVIGLPCAVAATTALRSMLYGVGPWDAGTFAVAAATLAAACLVATLLPAVRAASVSPTVALKEQ